ncbi:MAG TPA: SDR family oxidoreductase [Gallionella sp.]|nr:SDR family oxidoreductase [Gallionella sp.]
MKSLLIVGCGEVARRVIPLLSRHYRMFALVRRWDLVEPLRVLQVTPILGDLDDRASLYRLGGLADTVLHFAPPPDSGTRDPRTANLLAALARGKLPQRLIYLSTSGVYGDCGGAWVTEARPLHPQTKRALRRVDAERLIRAWAARNGVNANILRVPGIYAADRLPLDRIRRGVPAIIANEDSYTNHIHADDLARIAVAALRHGVPNRVYHACDGSVMKLGEYLDLVADAQGLPRVPRISRTVARQVLLATLLSFLNESRQLSNQRLRHELRVQLRYQSVTNVLIP